MFTTPSGSIPMIILGTPSASWYKPPYPPSYGNSPLIMAGLPEEPLITLTAASWSSWAKLLLNAAIADSSGVPGFTGLNL